MLIPVVWASTGETVLFTGFGGHANVRVDLGLGHPTLTVVAWNYKHSTFGAFQEVIVRVFDDEGALLGLFKITDSAAYRDMWVGMGSLAETIVLYSA